MKRIIPLILCLLLLVACADKPEEPADKTRTPQSEKTEAPAPKPTRNPEAPSPSPFAPPFPFTHENYPRVDGSTATIPLIAAVESVLLGKPRSEITVNVRKTSGAYTALANSEADLLLV